MNELFNHLWQSTVFAALVALVVVGLRRNSPRLRYCLWFAASMKFLVPFSLLVSTGARVRMPPDAPSLHAVTVQQISMAFSPAPVFSAYQPAHQRFHWEWIAFSIWALGALFLVVRWFRNWRETKAAVLEPGVVGIFRPVLVLPEGISNLLTEEQLQAVLAHEARHIECYDNLTAALHMVVETLFWFHPLVWWIGARLMDERERDCDEAVLRQGSRPGDYARSIVRVCETYLESPLACASGISGSDLKKRVWEIMTWRGSLPVTRSAKAMLAIAAFAAALVPFAIGIIRAQTLPAPPAYTYEVVSIHPSDPALTNVSVNPGPQGGLRIGNATALFLLSLAYGLQNYQIVNAPAWMSSDHFDVSFTPDKPAPAPGPGATAKDLQAYLSRDQQRMQAVLRDRFSLVLRVDTRELPIYSLTKAKSGSKLLPHAEGTAGPSIKNGRWQVTANGATLDMLAKRLSTELGRPVIDETGLGGEYDFKLTWTPDLESPQARGSEGGSESATGASIFTALSDQLGLRLEARKGPVQVYVVEKIERPSEN